jgi:hypothetical protein
MNITFSTFPGGRAALPAAGLFSLALSVAVSASAGTPAPTTPNDFKYPGTQPGTITAPLATPSNCIGCHSGYGSPDKEPWRTWQGSMVAQSGRDPLTYAAMAIANQDAPHTGELCIRCHMPKAWLEGRSTPEDASATTADDRQGVQCSACHRLVDPDPGSPGAPASDAAILAGLSAPVVTTGGGQMVVDPVDTVRGPFDLVADLGSDPHAPTRTALQAPYQESSQLCGTCHNVLNPVFQRNMSGGYDLGAWDAPGDPALAFPEQHTYAEWSLSAYAAGGVHAPQFAGNGHGVDGDYTVGSCQSCHMPRVTGKAAWTGVERTNMPNHDLVGANTLVPGMIADHPVFGAEVDAAVLDEGAAKALRMLRRAATVGASIDAGVLTVRVTNETGHKLPTGYPDGRRMWLSVQAFDADDQVVFESGLYDLAEAELHGYEAVPMDPDYDANLKVWETHQGIDPVVAMATGNNAGPGFHLALNSVREFDNRIPPRGFSNAAFAADDAEPVGATFADGQYWEDVTYPVGTAAVRAEVKLLYQTTTKEYMEFLRDENVTNSDGDIAYDLWEQAGKGPPVEMARVVADSDAKRVNGCRTNVSKLQSKYLKAFVKEWGGCQADAAAGGTCDTGTVGTAVAEAAAALREKLGGASDKKCEGAGLTPASIGLGSYCPTPCANIVLFDMDDVADCAICQADAVADAALESAYGVVPPAVPAAVPAGAPAACQKNLASAATGLATKWPSALKSCEKDNASGKNTPAVDCSTDPKDKIAKAQASAAGKVDKCTAFTGIVGCADGAADNAAAYQCIEDALGAAVPPSVSVAYP